MKRFFSVLLAVMALISCLSVYAGTRFQANVSCHDGYKSCISGAREREIGGFKLYKDCWEWGYSKKCDYKSKDDCRQYKGRCPWAMSHECLMRDSNGDCVNLKQEFSCPRAVPVDIEIEQKRSKVDFEEKDGIESWICDGIPCIDGNCMDKRYQQNGEMFDGLAKLYAAKEAGKNASNGRSNTAPLNQYELNSIQVFGSQQRHCSHKPTEYTDCCSTKMSGWGQNFGVQCTKNEKDLLDLKKQKRCEYVGATDHEIDPFGAFKIKKIHYCCFPNLLIKAIRMGAIAQGKANGLTTSCHGMTLEQLSRVDFHALDLSEAIDELKTRFTSKSKGKLDGADIKQRIEAILPNSAIRQGEEDPKKGKLNGVGKNFNGDKQ